MGAHAERMAQGSNHGSWGGKKNRFGGERYPLDVIIEGDTGITQQFERQQDVKAVAEFNRKIRAWGTVVNDGLIYSVARWINDDEKLSASIKQNYRHWGKVPAKGEEITSIGFRFEEEGITRNFRCMS